MWNVPPPRITAENVLVRCSTFGTDYDFNLRMRASIKEINDADRRYSAAASVGALHTLNKQDFLLSNVTGEEMVRTYEERFVAGAGRKFYDDIKAASPNKRCPMCGLREVAQIDHNLPKDSFPALAINPMNLTPVCSDCNYIKRNFIAASEVEQLLHPYFDDVQTDRWLHASVIEAVPASFVFMVNDPGNWPAALLARVTNQFTKLRLGELYTSHSGQELASIRHNLKKLYALSGESSLVRAHLEDAAESRRKNEVNSWRTAMYQAMIDSAWFCEGGFVPGG